MFKKILVPYDTSKPAASAARYAAQLAKSSEANCEITLVHVIPSIPASPILLDRPLRSKKGETVMLSEYVKQLYEEMQENARESLNKKQKEIETEVGSKVKVGSVVLLGDSISGKIIELAETDEIDLIIIGNVGLSGLSKLKTLGSVSRAVSERSPCPVLIVH
jgi:nucleotide-binding universal stress UspA family protein